MLALRLDWFSSKFVKGWGLNIKSLDAAHCHYLQQYIQQIKAFISQALFKKTNLFNNPSIAQNDDPSESTISFIQVYFMQPKISHTNVASEASHLMTYQQTDIEGTSVKNTVTTAILNKETRV